MIYVCIVLCVIMLLSLIYLIYKVNKSSNVKALDNSEDIKKIADDLNAMRMEFVGIKQSFDTFSNLTAQNLRNMGESQVSTIKNIGDTQTAQIRELENRLNTVFGNTEARLERITRTISDGLNSIRASNDEQLEKMRATVDEKLDKTLSDRLDSAFKNIITTLDNVQKSAGEMKLAVDSVSDFKRMISGVKTRGIWGEVQLGNVLEQMLSPNQYGSQVSVDGSSERVDFVVKLPGKNQDEIIYLPIDAKFPVEDYSRLCDASEHGDSKQIEQCQKDLVKSIKKQAKSISEKYIKLPKTTEFAVMYLPIEGLYAEVVKDSSLCDMIQRDYRVIVCGPNTVTALLSSLQMGFKTLAIEKRSGEIWELLGTFKKEFSNFADLLEKTKKQIDGASNTIDDATKKTKTIERKLKSVADIEPPKDNDLITFD